MKKLARYWIFLGMLLCIAPGISMAATVDVLVVYTPEAQTHAAAYDILRWGVEAINAKIAFMVSETNLIFANSGINNHRLRLVGRHMVDHDETNDLHSELTRLSDINHFKFPELQQADGFSLTLISVATVNDIPDHFTSFGVIVALVGTDLHVRIFDKNGTKVLDKAENRLNNGENLTALKQLLTPFPDISDLTEDEISEILEYVRLVAMPNLDGHMDIVHTWRNEVGADVVALIIASDTGSVSGTGIGVTKNDSFSDAKGFFVIDQNATIVLLFPDRIGMLFTHELGHVLGCNHVINEAGAPSPDAAWRDGFDAISHAYAQKFWYGGVLYGTVMAVPNSSAFSIPIPYFSNHTVYYPPGWPWPQPTGTTTANNAGVIMRTANYVADYRETTIPHGSIWVDTGWGGYENGSVSYPYNTVQEGIYNVDYGGSIVFEHGSDPWTGTITKPMTITAGVGEMVIGR